MTESGERGLPRFIALLILDIEFFQIPGKCTNDDVI